MHALTLVQSEPTGTLQKCLPGRQTFLRRRNSFHTANQQHTGYQAVRNGCLDIPSLDSLQSSTTKISQLPVSHPNSPSGLAYADNLNSACSRLFDTLELDFTPSITASQHTQWLQPSISTGPVPQPDFQDFGLFATPGTPLQAPQPPRQAHLPASNQHPPFNMQSPQAGSVAKPLGSIHQIPRQKVPQEPLFHPNQVADQALSKTAVGMTEEIKVAYNGAAADLGSSDLPIFSWDDLANSNESLVPANIGAGNAPGTISPRDLLLNSNVDSVPASTAFTNLSTPDSAYLDTPADAYETSPMLDSLDGPEIWPSLFPDAEETSTAVSHGMSRNASDSSQVVHPGATSHKRASTSKSPITSSARLSSVAGVSKRDRPLPAIVVDTNDPVALKRARNTAAARKSRARKVQEVERLKIEVARLREEAEHWKAIALGKAS